MTHANRTASGSSGAASPYWKCGYNVAYAKGGKTGASLYALIQSALRNCIDVWHYLTDVLRRIAAIAPGDTAALEALLPDCWLAAHPEHWLEQREEESREAQARRRRKRAARRVAAAQ